MGRNSDPAPAARLYCPMCEQEEFAGVLCPRDGTRLVRLSADTDPLVGRVLDDRFTIEAKLGAGGMGAVYRARQHSVGRPVAIKVVTPAYVADPQAIKRFLREAKLASQLAHPNIVSVLDFGQTADGLFYLVMELVSGRTLHEVMLGEGRMSLERVVRIGSQICDALEGAHAVPMMHRDLKPANVMLLSAGRDLVKVLDFGLAKSLAVDKSAASNMTSTGALLGTPTFMPPEVANGLAVDERADLYSLGCMLFMMIAGRAPFVTDSIPEMIAMHGTVPAPRLRGSEPFADVIATLLEKDPNRRYPTAAATRAALEGALRAAERGADHADTYDEEIPDPPSIVPVSRETVPSIEEPRPAAALGSLSPPPSEDERPTAIRSVTPMPFVPPLPLPTPTPTMRTRSRAPLLLVAALALVLVAIAVVAIGRRGSTPSRSVAPVVDAAPRVDTAPIVTPIDIDAAAPIALDAALAVPPPLDAASRPSRDAGVTTHRPPPDAKPVVVPRPPPDARLPIDAPF